MWRFSPLQRSLWDLYHWLVPLVAINILWFLLSLTVLALPAATAALCEIALDVEVGYSPGVGRYLSATRRWLFKGWWWGAAVVALTAVTLVALPFYAAQTGALWMVVFVLSAVVAAFAWAVAFYFWPYLLLQAQPLMLRALRNAALTVAASPLYALLYSGLSAVLITLSVLYVVPILVVTPIGVAFLSTYSLKMWLVRHGLDNGDGDDGHVSSD